VLSGGGARAFAHIGAVQALRDAKAPFDFIGGASMGATIAAGLAIGWNQEEMDRRMHQAFVDTNPLDDMAFPMLAMTTGKKVDRRLEEHFGEVLIEDLPTPYFCVSSNLTTGSYHLHKRGLLRQALRASISLPGILPPVLMDGGVLVDGAVMRSYPADIMRAWHNGTVVGVDVTRARGIDPRTLEHPMSLARFILTGAWRRGPPIVSIMMRSATITHAGELAQGRAATDLLVIPQPHGVEIRDWKAYDQAVDAGYQSMTEALARLEGPVTMLRRRQLSYQPAEPIITLDEELPETIAGTAKASSRPAASGKRGQAGRDKRRGSPSDRRRS
jgi:NTE family protein